MKNKTESHAVALAVHHAVACSKGGKAENKFIKTISKIKAKVLI
jgi:hypothetical protein